MDSRLCSSKVMIDSIKFPCLGMEYYDENVLMALASAVRKPIIVDFRTLEASRGKFARVCVEINLNQPVVGNFWFRGRWFNVAYEGLHLLCKSYGIYGHTKSNCPNKKVIPSVQLSPAMMRCPEQSSGTQVSQ